MLLDHFSHVFISVKWMLLRCSPVHKDTTICSEQYRRVDYRSLARWGFESWKARFSSMPLSPGKRVGRVSMFKTMKNLSTVSDILLSLMCECQVLISWRIPAGDQRAEGRWVMNPATLYYLLLGRLWCGGVASISKPSNIPLNSSQAF